MRNWQTKKLNELLTQRKEQVIILPDDEYALVTISNKNMCFPDSIVGVRPKKETCQDYILMLLQHYQPYVRKLSYQMAGQPNIKLPTLNNCSMCFTSPPRTKIHSRQSRKTPCLLQPT